MVLSRRFVVCPPWDVYAPDNHSQTIFPGALAAPHSPIVPHTPFHSSTTPAFLSSATLLPPRTPYTPYTPFTAFHAKQAPSTYALGKSQSPYAHFLDESDEPLAKLYSQVLRFVERDLCRIMDVAEKVFVKSVSSSGRPDRGDASTPQSVVAAQSAARPDGEGFEILANVVWEVFGRAIMDDLGNSVFAAGRPNEFRKVCLQPIGVRCSWTLISRTELRDNTGLHTLSRIPRSLCPGH